MPYGIAKRLGGDTSAVDARMERCVKDVMAKGHDKLSAILICKTSVQKGLAKKK